MTTIVIFAIFAKFASIAKLLSAPHCFVLFPVGDSGKIVIFAIFAKFAIMFSFLPFLLLRAFLDISQHVWLREVVFSARRLSLVRRLI